MKNAIGVFDSGVGGLTVARELCDNFQMKLYIILEM